MIKLSLNKEIYSFEIISETMDAYRDFAKFRLKDQEHYWILAFDQCKYEEEITAKEFENYLIGLLFKEMRGANN